MESGEESDGERGGGGVWRCACVVRYGSDAGNVGASSGVPGTFRVFLIDSAGFKTPRGTACALD